MRQSGRSWKSPGVKQDLFDMGLSSNSVKTAFENAQSVIDNEEMIFLEKLEEICCERLW